MGEMTNEEAIKHNHMALCRTGRAAEESGAGAGIGGCYSPRRWYGHECPYHASRAAATLEQLRGMDGKCVKVVIEGVEPLEMLALVEAPEDEDCVLLRNNLGGVSEFYSDDDLREDGVKVYAYSSANINREAWEPCAVCSISHKHWAERQYSYCPYCDRPLTEEAWAELEKRVRGE